MGNRSFTDAQCEQLKDLCNITHFDPPDDKTPGGKFNNLVGLELKDPEDLDAQFQFQVLKEQLTAQGNHFATVDVTNGLYVMHCPGHPCGGLL